MTGSVSTAGRTQGRVLIIAGSDSGGGAGIQGDIKTVTALGGYAMTAITALTAQNTLGVASVYGIPPDFIAEQIRVTVSDLGVDCIKIGMLHSAEVIDAVADTIEAECPGVPLVLDPVMVAKGGASLLAPEAITTFKRRLPVLATIMTPNVPEAEVLTGLKIVDVDAAEHAATMLPTLGASAVLLKGGHMPGDVVEDLLVDASGLRRLRHARIETEHTHGTGCTLASAIATGLAQGLDLDRSVDRAIAYVWRAIETAPKLGRGHGPLNHAHTVRPFTGKDD